MQMRHRAALDGVELDGIDNRIMISRVETGAGKENISAVSLYGGSGSRVTEVHRDSLDVTVRFFIRLKKREMAARSEVLEKANAWAYAGGWLTSNIKPERRIRVFLAQAAEAGDPWDWTREYALVFRACGVPYWQTTNPEVAQKVNTSGCSFTLGCTGSAKSVMEVQFKNTSGGTVNTFSISNGDSSMSLSGLGLGNGETLLIDHADNGRKSVLRIRIRSTGGSYRSALASRNSGSSDDLHISPGIHTVSMSAGGAGQLTVTSCGRFA